MASGDDRANPELRTVDGAGVERVANGGQGGLRLGAHALIDPEGISFEVAAAVSDVTAPQADCHRGLGRGAQVVVVDCGDDPEELALAGGKPYLAYERLRGCGREPDGAVRR